MNDSREHSTKPYGSDDEIGALNLLTPQHILNAIQLVRRGHVYDLDPGRFMGMPLWPGHPALTILGYRSPSGLAVMDDMAKYHPSSRNTEHMGFNTELVMGTMHTGCHIDALSHITVGEDPHWYNGFRAAEYLSDHGPLRADIAAMPPIFARGVLADVASYHGMDRLPAGYGIKRDELQAVLKSQGTTLNEGDVLLLRTGMMRDWPNGAKMHEVEGAGLHIDGARWLAEEVRVAAVGADNTGVEMTPGGDDHVSLPVHVYMLVEHGVPLIEFVQLEELARDQIYEFLFVALPLKIKGATGSMLRPVAVV